MTTEVTVADNPTVQVTGKQATGKHVTHGSTPSNGPRILALLNQKGGVGKTTTTVNLGAALVRRGKRVLLIDLDPQAHLTLHVGVDPDSVEHTVYDLLTRPELGAGEVVQTISEQMSLLPAEVNLAGVETELATLAAVGKAQRILADKVGLMLAGQADGGAVSSAAPDAQSLAPHSYDFVLIDCPPSLGLLTINALALANEVLVPMQAHFLALQGLSKLLETVSLVKRSVNPRLLVTGIIPCMFEGQTVLAGEVMADLKTFFDAARSMDVPWRNAVVLEPAVRRNIKLAECPSFGKTIFDYAPDSNGAKDYLALAEALLGMEEGKATSEGPALTTATIA
ncbi:MAG: ParA family protein [Phycisphaeraceae bacterium]|nr:ParA family protein [Phycisphaeraceae bacterium]